MSEAVPSSVPLPVTRLHIARDTAQREDAWAEFAAAYSPLVLHACRRVTDGDSDQAMDAFAYVLEALREDDCRRLRAFTPDGRTRFTTWLVVVVRRLALDHLRARYGRSRSERTERREQQAARRRLEDLLAERIEPDELTARDPSAELQLRRAELRERLRMAVGTLEPADRLLLTLRFVDDASIREISRVLRAGSVFHVYRRLAAVLAQLRATLEKSGVRQAQP